MPYPITFYSEKYAKRVCLAFIEKHARATEKTAQILRIDYFKLIYMMKKYARHNQKRWVAVKKVIKSVENNELIAETNEMMLNYLTFEKQKYISDALDLEEITDIPKIWLDIDKVFDIDFICTGRQ